MISNTMFENQYSSTIEKKYGPPRNAASDEELLRTNVVPHPYSVADRVDCTGHPLYTIDPKGCEDADDGFSVYTLDGDTYLDIHIADPTEYINPQSDLWTDVVKRVCTRYPSNRRSIHMLPREIVGMASLIDNEYGNRKNVITVRTQIDPSTGSPVGAVRLLFAEVLADNQYRYSYTQAAGLIGSSPVLDAALRISRALTQRRAERTIGARLNEVSNSYPVFAGPAPQLHRSTPGEKSMKQMIAEFAIYANSFVGEYLKIHLHGLGIFRTCNASEWLQTVGDGVGGQELLNRIVMEGIQADYLAENASHDLVGMPEYCHFTSPIRRLPDCVCHYLLKHIHLQNVIPFPEAKLETYADEIHKHTKKMKNVQHADAKFRIIQTMSHTLAVTQTPIRITYFIASYTGLFLNLIISSVGNHPVQISYTLRIKNFYGPPGAPHETHDLDITEVHCPGEYDQGSIPELDQLMYSYST